MKKYILLTSLVVGLTSQVTVFAAHDHEHAAEAKKIVAPKSESLFNINDVWTSSEGKQVQLAQFSGKPTVIAMVYTSCQYVCPMIVSDMQRIEKSLSKAENDKVNYAVFSFDPDRDTPERLKEFAIAHRVNPDNWTLATSNASAVRKLAVSLGIKYKKDKSGDFDHDAVITILDSDGVIKYQQNSVGKNMDEATAVLKKLMR